MTPAAVVTISVMIFHMVTTVYSQPCDKTKPNNTNDRLKQDIFCNYNKDEEPNNENRTIISLAMGPLYLDFDDANSKLKLTSWLVMRWQDKRLQWDEAQYDNISMLILDTRTIWVPDMTVYNSASADFGMLTVGMTLDSMTIRCIANSRGFVVTLTQIKDVFHCVPDWYNWPYDVHTCEMYMGSKAYMYSKLDFDVFDKKLYMKNYIPHREWYILNTSSSKEVINFGLQNDTSVYTVSFKLTLKRHASVYVASYLIPGIVMIVISLCVPWMDTSRSERTYILCALIILQSLYIQYIAYKLPSNGDKTPRIVCFYKDLLFITVYLFIETLITRHMVSWSWKPDFLQSICNFMVNNKSAQLIVLINSDPKNAAELAEEAGGEAVRLVTSLQGGSNQWQMLSLLINRLTFVIVLVVSLFISLYLFP